MGNKVKVLENQTEVLPTGQFEASCEAGELVFKIPTGIFHLIPSTDPDYPGFYVDFQPNGSEYATQVAAFEASKVDQTLSTAIWGDFLNEDYTDKIIFQNIEESKAIE